MQPDGSTDDADGYDRKTDDDWTIEWGRLAEPPPGGIKVSGSNPVRHPQPLPRESATCVTKCDRPSLLRQVGRSNPEVGAVVELSLDDIADAADWPSADQGFGEPQLRQLPVT